MSAALWVGVFVALAAAIVGVPLALWAERKND
jgi:ABC-type spermidine/putrescine transport system permease subunit I